MQLSHAPRLDLDFTIQALMQEVSNLEKLRRQFDKSDQLILQDCSIRLNRLMLEKLSASHHSCV